MKHSQPLFLIKNTHAVKLSNLSFSISPLFIPLLSLTGGITGAFYYCKESLGIPFFLTASLLIALNIYLLFKKQYIIFGVCIASLLIGSIHTLNIWSHYHDFTISTLNNNHNLFLKIENKHISGSTRMKHVLIATLLNKEVKGYKIQIYTTQSNNVQIGDCIAVPYIPLKRPSKNNFDLYLMREGIAATVFIETLSYKLINRPKYSLWRFIFNYKNKILQSFEKQLSPYAFTLFCSFFMGEKMNNKKMSEHLHVYCKRWGISHFLARSGLHLVIVLSIYELLFRFIPLPFILKIILLILLNIIYFLLSCVSVSFLRAFITFIIYKITSFLSIPAHFLHILTTTCMIILLWNPLHLFFLDFQLSFCLTFALGWLNQYKTANS